MLQCHSGLAASLHDACEHPRELLAPRRRLLLEPRRIFTRGEPTLGEMVAEYLRERVKAK
jgi:hypothetical protein